MFRIPEHDRRDVHGERLHEWRGAVRAKNDPGVEIQVTDRSVAQIKFDAWTPVIPPFRLIPAVVSLEETNEERGSEILGECLHERELVL